MSLACCAAGQTAKCRTTCCVWVWEKRVRLIEGDLESISSIGSAITASDPDIIFHLAAQSFVPRSFVDPNETMLCNCWGTSNLLEAIRIKDADPVVVFAGSSEEYGLVLSSEEQYKRGHGEIRHNISCA